VLHAELTDFVRNFVEIDHFLLEDVLQENNHKSDHPLLVYFVFVRLRLGVGTWAALVHAVLQKQLNELFWKLNVVRQSVENFKQIRWKFHAR
jgi:hypothetical protein